MLIKLAWQSFKKQSRGYLLFFFSMSFAVMVYYSFTTMTYEQPLVRQVGNTTNIVNFLAFGSVMIGMVLLFFLLSTSHYFIESRRKDIAIFHLYGLKYDQICLLFILELFFIGGLSFIAGIVLGILLSRMFSMILLKAMGLAINVNFFLSIRGVWTTALVMLFILSVVSLQVLWRISKHSLSSMKRKRADTRRQMRLSKLQKFGGVIGCALILFGWGAALNFPFLVKILAQGHDLFTGTLFLMVGIFLVCVLGTYLFFSFTIRWFLARRTHSDYQTLRFLSKSEGQKQLYTERFFLASVTILLGLALTFLGGIAALVSIQMNGITESAPVSLMIDQRSWQDIQPEIIGIPITQQQDLHFKAAGAKTPLVIIGQLDQEEPPTTVDLIALSEYQAFRRMNPRVPAVKLSNELDTVLLISSQTVFNDYLRYSPELELSQHSLRVQGIKNNNLGDWNLRYSRNLFVVSDELFRQTEGISYTVTAVQVAEADQSQLENQLKHTLSMDWIAPIQNDLQFQQGTIIGTITEGEGDNAVYRVNYVSYPETYQTTRNRTGLLLFVTTFVTMTFIIITASTISLRQLSDMKGRQRHYQLLKNLGISRKQRNWLIFRENQWMFFPSAILGVGHSFFAIYVLARLVENADYWFVYLFCGILLAVYTSFFYITYRYQRKLLK
ncbi:ABC transporter permease [Enterococcus florum]|uniref:ABC transporter permease n=1 Tax=Enterococcus florum TaxID=2480627 RepID=A0A4V0WP76_9ENTE|nr:ABC transporter permease [Enterococcus florum]GCF92889.1 ABC transporter permease [Enterococcus florum]